MIYFNSKYLAERLGIPPAKWKRWAREFLPPDPLGGYQSGYARQFSYKDALRVFIGGHLVAEQKFTIPDARQILHDLDAWIRRSGLYALPDPTQRRKQKNCHIYIYPLPAGKFAYAIRIVKEYESKPDHLIYSETYALELIGSGSDLLAGDQIGHARILVMNVLYGYFLECVITP